MYYDNVCGDYLNFEDGDGYLEDYDVVLRKWVIFWEKCEGVDFEGECGL